MTILHLDLDNTLIYSFRHPIGNDRICVESSQNRELSFLTRYTYEKLKQINERLFVVPTSTRSIEQYQRIRLGIGSIPRALVCNGGVLLVNGEKHIPWYQQSLSLIQESLPTLQAAEYFLQKDPRRTFELRFIEKLFLFTKCSQPDSVAEELRKLVDPALVDVICNKEKLYVVPVNLSKGKAVERFRKHFRAARVIAAGDRQFDISMLREADMGIVPQGFTEKYPLDFPVEEMPGKRTFSDEMSERIWELCQETDPL